MSTNSKRRLSLIAIAAGCTLILQLLNGCKPNDKAFSGELAYKHVEALVNFGPREPGSQSIIKAQNYIETELNEFGWKIFRQSFSDQTPQGEKDF
ncbi:MAG: hypothetical protein VYA96_02480, partial [Verrucomicrobiota bacterium]|nr:hypothetical protein [Verrucomicrobiota bacterium]